MNLFEFVTKLMAFLEGKKTYLSGLGMALGLIGTAISYKYGLVDKDTAIVLLTTFAGLFGGGAVIFQRQATAKLEKPVVHLDIVPISRTPNGDGEKNDTQS